MAYETTYFYKCEACPGIVAQGTGYNRIKGAVTPVLALAGSVIGPIGTAIGIAVGATVATDSKDGICMDCGTQYGRTQVRHLQKTALSKQQLSAYRAKGFKLRRPM